MAVIPQVIDAEAKQFQLDRMKRRATGLLVLMGVVFVAAWLLEPAHPWLGYVRATAEAGMVGGVADWFAITALFRRPLNLPDPPHRHHPLRGRTGSGGASATSSRTTSSRPRCWAPSCARRRLSRRAAEWLREPEHARHGRPPGGGRAPERHRRRPRRRRARVPRAQRDRAAQAAADRPGARQRARPCSPPTTGTSSCSTGWCTASPGCWPRTRS